MYGPSQGIYSALGTLVGQFCFAFCILFGFRSLIITWFSFPFLHFIIYIFLTVKMFWEAFSIRVFDIEITKTKRYLNNYFFLNFLISWTEQTSIFRYFGNLTFSPEPNALETVLSTTEFDSSLLTGYYIIGLSFGSIFFTALLGLVLLSFQNYIYDYHYLNSYGAWRRKVHILFKRLILGFFVLSSPFKYYSYDYFSTGPLGYVYDDFNLHRSFFSLSATKNNTSSKFMTDWNQNNTYHINLSPFDDSKHIRRLWHTLSFENLRHCSEHETYRMRIGLARAYYLKFPIAIKVNKIFRREIIAKYRPITFKCYTFKKLKKQRFGDQKKDTINNKT